MAETVDTETATEDTTEGTDAPETGAQGQDGAEEEVAPTLESVQAELEQTRRALAKANKDGERNRRKAQEAKPADEVVSDAEAAAAAKWKPAVVRSEAKAAFTSAGLQADPASLPRVLRLLDLDELTITEDGEVEGLADQVEEIKLALPALFAVASTAKPKQPRVDAAAKAKPEPQKPKGDAARLFAALDASG